jgi:hypothetical protein
MRTTGNSFLPMITVLVLCFSWSDESWHHPVDLCETEHHAVELGTSVICRI